MRAALADAVRAISDAISNGDLSRPELAALSPELAKLLEAARVQLFAPVPVAALRPDRSLNAKESCERLGVSKGTFYDKVKQGEYKLFARHEGRKVLCSERGLERYIASGTKS